MSKLAFRPQTVDIAYLPLRQDLFGISVWATARKLLIFKLPIPWTLTLPWMTGCQNIIASTSFRNSDKVAGLRAEIGIPPMLLAR